MVVGDDGGGDDDGDGGGGGDGGGRLRGEWRCRERRLCLPLVISWYLLPVEASSSYDAVHLPHEKPSLARRQLDGAASPMQ
ncbi:hypothetical protein RF55_593 [Lasius niger]|uniref:Uncharacterized protein n=1 Tax=Lasius niger TaxID=67767 RepID=A0A0J7L8V9_LASNI|nr:hypothetical protein RF55_593 [Lasius niger]